MKNTYSFSFLTSPDNPRSDNWIGQNYILSYLNSDQGTSFLFKYKPYELMDSRVNANRKLSQSSENIAVERPYFAGERDLLQESISFSSFQYGTKDIQEMLAHRGFQSILREITSSYEYIVYLSQLRDPDVYLNKGYLNGENAEPQESIHPHRRNLFERIHLLRDSIRSVEDDLRSDRKREDEALAVFMNALQSSRLPHAFQILGQYFIGYVEKLRNGDPLTLYIGDYRHDYRWLSASNRDRSIIMDMQEIPIHFLYDEKWGDTQFNNEAHRDTPSFSGQQVHDRIGITEEKMELGTLPEEERLAHLLHIPNAGTLSIDQGIIRHYTNAGEKIVEESYGVNPLTIGTPIDHFGFLFSEVPLFQKSNENQGYRQQDHRLGIDFQVDAWVNVLFSSMEKDSSWESRSIQPFVLASYSPTQDGMIANLQAKADHFPRRAEEVLHSIWAYHTVSSDGKIAEIPFTLCDRYGFQSHTPMEWAWGEFLGKGVFNIGIQYERVGDVEYRGHIDTRTILGKVEGIEPQAFYSYQMIRSEFLGKDGLQVLHRPRMDEKLNREMEILDEKIVRVHVIPKDARSFEHRTIFAIPLPLDTWIQDRAAIDEIYGSLISSSAGIDIHTPWLDEKILKDVSPVIDSIQVDEKIRKNIRYEFIDQQIDKLLINARDTGIMIKRMDEVKIEAWFSWAYNNLNKSAKASLLVNNWIMFKKVSKEYMDLEDYLQTIWAKWLKVPGGYTPGPSPEDDLDDIIETFNAFINHGQFNKKAEKDEHFKEVQNFIVHTIASRPDLDVLLDDLVGGAQRVDYFRTVVEEYIQTQRHREPHGRIEEWKHAHNPEKMSRDTPDIIQIKLGNEPEIYGLLQQVINAHDRTRDEMIGVKLEEQRLVQDPSDWEDIWKKYTGGKDVIDVPNYDYDYTNLADQVYDPLTGVPKDPLSPVNVADVKVRIPLHHPLPAHFDLGTEEVIVDNFIFMDTLLAIYSLMNRNKLSYAGMPAEQTMRGMFSKLFAWIQGVAPGNKEYDRMYRFSRWYGEHTVLKMSQHILHREYDKWMTELHLGNDWGTPYTTTGWVYVPGASIMQTNATNATFEFMMENYIDSTLVVRGFLDNPSGGGKLEFLIDGIVEKTLTAHGVFTIDQEIMQDNHLYQFRFTGALGKASISSMEIGGAKFIRAYTTSDDSNTNGLKALTKLIEMLVHYYDIHHSDGKIKGMMELKQRKLMNWQ